MTDLDERPREAERRAGELTARELARFGWRQLTSMRTALVLLLLLALAAVPGSVIPQSGVDALKTSQWKQSHPTLTPIYERLGLFSVFDSVWFAAIYILLMISLVGCIVPRTAVYWRGLRAQPPATPGRLERLPDHRRFETDEGVDVVLERARSVFGRRRYRLRTHDPAPDSVSAERGYLREAGNLLFHISVLIVLVGFAIGGSFGYQGGVVLWKGQTFANTTTAYDDFDPGSLFRASDLNPFSFSFDDFGVEWLRAPGRSTTARKFEAAMHYADGLGPRTETYDLRVNHPLDIGGTDLFLIGHGYAPVVTVRDGEGNVAFSGPTVFLPQDATFTSFGVIKVASARPGQIGLDGLFLPNDDPQDGQPFSYDPDAYYGATGLGPLLTMSVYTGDLGLDQAQSIYELDTRRATRVKAADGKPFRLDIRPGQTKRLPDGLGSVTFDGIKPWVRIQLSQTPGKRIALLGVVLALIGLLGSLFVRPRRVWVRARREGGVTMVEVAALDRSGGGDVTEVLDRIVTDLRGDLGISQLEEKT